MNTRTPSRLNASPLVKLCGLRREEDVEAAVAAGADFAGIVFAESSRRVSIEQAGELVRVGRGRVRFVGVFSGLDAPAIDDIAARTNIDLVQIADSLTMASLASLKTPFIATVHVRKAMHEDQILHIVNLYRGATALLVDSWSPMGGGSGVAPDWDIARAFVRASPIPVILAGGLRVDNVTNAMVTVRPAGVDVSSGIEVDGWKHAELMARFVENVRRSSTTDENHRGIGRNTKGDLQW